MREPVDEGRTALWNAVYEGRPDQAALLVAAGGDPWRDMMSGWSPGRLALAGPTPELFGPPPAGAALTPEESETVLRAKSVIAALAGSATPAGWSVAAVAGVSAEEAVARVGGLLLDHPTDWSFDDVVAFGINPPFDYGGIGAHDFRGGCVVVHPLGYDASTPRVLRLLSRGARAYGVVDNQADGPQGTLAVNGVFVGWDLNPGGEPDPEDHHREVLAKFLARGVSSAAALVVACLTAGVYPNAPGLFAGSYRQVFRLDTDVDWFDQGESPSRDG
jgi:hypothetical protein